MKTTHVSFSLWSHPEYSLSLTAQTSAIYSLHLVGFILQSIVFCKCEHLIFLTRVQSLRLLLVKYFFKATIALQRLYQSAYRSLPQIVINHQFAPRMSSIIRHNTFRAHLSITMISRCWDHFHWKDPLRWLKDRIKEWKIRPLTTRWKRAVMEFDATVTDVTCRCSSAVCLRHSAIIVRIQRILFFFRRKGTNSILA